MKPKIESKTWDPILESKIIKKWQNEHIYDFNADKNNFIIDTPPPYPSGSTWHIGAAAHYAQIDMIARTERMNGKNVYFPIGIDRNGLPVEIYTEKKHKIKIQDIKRKEFLKLCKRSLDELEKKMIEIMKSVGMSADFRNYYQTDSDKYRTLTQSTFIELWKKNYIYTANRPNNYDCLIGTTVSDAEIIYKDVQTKLVHIKFKLKKDKNIIVSTTRPELLWACKAIIVNPDDDRYTKFIGKNAIIPLTKKEIKIMAHRSVQKEFGSGAVMICSYGDQQDVPLFRELKL